MLQQLWALTRLRNCARCCRDGGQEKPPHAEPARVPAAAAALSAAACCAAMRGYLQCAMGPRRPSLARQGRSGQSPRQRQATMQGHLRPHRHQRPCHHRGCRRWEPHARPVPACEQSHRRQHHVVGWRQQHSARRARRHLAATRPRRPRCDLSVASQRESRTLHRRARARQASPHPSPAAVAYGRHHSPLRQLTTSRVREQRARSSHLLLSQMDQLRRLQDACAAEPCVMSHRESSGCRSASPGCREFRERMRLRRRHHHHRRRRRPHHRGRVHIDCVARPAHPRHGRTRRRHGRHGDRHHARGSHDDARHGGPQPRCAAAARVREHHHGHETLQARGRRHQQRRPGRQQRLG